MHIFLDNATTPRRVPLARKYDAKAVWRGDFASQGVRQELSVFCEEQDMSESPPEPTKRHAGYAVLEEDGTIVRLERNRWIANEVADRLPGRRVVPLWILDDGDDNEQTLDI